MYLKGSCLTEVQVQRWSNSNSTTFLWAQDLSHHHSSYFLTSSPHQWDGGIMRKIIPVSVQFEHVLAWGRGWGSSSCCTPYRTERGLGKHPFHHFAASQGPLSNMSNYSESFLFNVLLNQLNNLLVYDGERESDELKFCFGDCNNKNILSSFVVRQSSVIHCRSWGAGRNGNQRCQAQTEWIGRSTAESKARPCSADERVSGANELQAGPGCWDRNLQEAAGRRGNQVGWKPQSSIRVGQFMRKYKFWRVVTVVISFWLQS